jgi:glycine dehydrogenase
MPLSIPRPTTRKSFVNFSLKCQFSVSNCLAVSRATHRPSRTFADRHIGPDIHESRYMLKELGYKSMDQFITDTVPESIRVDPDLISDDTIPPLSEADLLREAKLIGSKNSPFRSYIGMGYHTAVVPTPILRSVSSPFVTQFSSPILISFQIMEAPSWYTQYTPYQPEIAQGI